MYGIFLSAARYMLILFFGVFASAAIADIRLNKKNLLILIVFYICNCLIQLVILLTDNIQHVILYYPVITHLPLFLLFVLVLYNLACCNYQRIPVLSDMQLEFYHPKIYGGCLMDCRYYIYCSTYSVIPHSYALYRTLHVQTVYKRKHICTDVRNSSCFLLCI